jgi:8-oxo-dGTP diphosphatase
MERTAESERLNEDGSNYDPTAYPRPAVTVDMAVCTVLDGAVKCLLVKRAFPPFRHAWAIPGGFVDIERGETLEQAALRSLRDETGLGGVYLEQLRTYGDPDRDPRMRVITVAYYGLLPASRIAALSPARPGPASVRWFPLHALPSRLAFDHRRILNDLAERLEGKVTYTPIAFSLLDKQFTWADLQAAHEAILRRKLLTPNFRRKMLSMYRLRELREKKKTGGRPSSYVVFEGQKEL